MVLPGVPLGVAFAERWLVDRATLERPDRSAPGGFAVAAADVPCRLGRDTGAVITTPGAAPTVQSPTVWFSRATVLAVDWRITVTSQGDRRLKVDAFGQAAEAPLLEVRTSGIR